MKERFIKTEQKVNVRLRVRQKASLPFSKTEKFLRRIQKCTSGTRLQDNVQIFRGAVKKKVRICLTSDRSEAYVRVMGSEVCVCVGGDFSLLVLLSIDYFHLFYG